jgi:hypothetical protein
MDMGLFGIVLLVLGAYALGISLLLLVGAYLGQSLGPQRLQANLADRSSARAPAGDAVEGDEAPAADHEERPRAGRRWRRAPITEYVRSRRQRRIERSAAATPRADH